MAIKTYIVSHPKLYLRVKGKLQPVEIDTEVSMEAKSAESLLKQGKLTIKGAGKTVDINSD